MLAAPEFLRLLVVGDCHTVALATLVLAQLELSDNEICLHLQLRDADIKILITFSAESRRRLQFKAGIHAASSKTSMIAL